MGFTPGSRDPGRKTFALSVSHLVNRALLGWEPVPLCFLFYTENCTRPSKRLIARRLLRVVPYAVFDTLAFDL
jgi:hypothetical protein